MQVSPELIRAQFQTIVEKNVLPLERDKALLLFLCEESLSRPEVRLTQAKVAQHLFKVKQPDADQVHNARTIVGRLRTALAVYYQNRGAADPIELSIPKEGSGYNLKFLPREQSSDRKHLWIIPRPNRFFTGRETFLATLRESLLANSSGPITQPHAITGLGGIGKTQAAIEYAYRYRKHYAYGFWMNAESRDSLLAGFVSIADRLELPNRGDGNVGRIAEAVRWWFECNTDWLLVLDNVDDLDLASPFIPSGNGHCLITTQLPRIGGLGETLELNRLEASEGILFLLRRAGRIPRTAGLEAVENTDWALASKLVEALEGVPLALDQAAAYIEEAPSTLAEYLDLYSIPGSSLRDVRGFYAAEHVSVTRTFDLALAKVEEKDPAAADIMRVGAFVAPQGIPEELFTSGGQYLGPHLSQIAGTPEFITDSLREVARFSLIKRNKNSKSIDVHRLVQQVVLDGMELETINLWVCRVAKALGLIFPSPDLPNWAICEKYASHVLALAWSIRLYELQDLAAAELFSKCGAYFRERGMHIDAHKLLSLALAIREKVLGPDDPETASSIYELAVLDECRRSFRSAERLYERALSIREKALGPDDPQTASSLEGLANVYCRGERLNEAERLYERALSIREKALGPDDPQTASSLEGLANVYCRGERLNEAERLYERALSIHEKTPGSDIGIARNLNRLGRLKFLAGFHAQAELLFRQSLKLHDELLGPEHPDLAHVLENYQQFLRALGREQDADELQKRIETLIANFVRTTTIVDATSLIWDICNSGYSTEEKEILISAYKAMTPDRESFRGFLQEVERVMLMHRQKEVGHHN